MNGSRAMPRAEFAMRRRAYRVWLRGPQATGYFRNEPRNSSAWQRGERGTWVETGVPGLSDLCDADLSAAIRARPPIEGDVRPVRFCTWSKRMIVASVAAQSRALSDRIRREREKRESAPYIPTRRAA